MRRPGRASALGLAFVGVVLLAACAARPPRGLTDRFVTPDDGGPGREATFDVKPSGRPTASTATEGEAIPVTPVPKVSPGPTLETESAALGAALAVLAVRESVDGHRKAAAEYWQARVFDRAESHLTRAIALRPRDAGLFAERARLWRDAGVLERALSDAHYAAYLAPRAAEAQNTLGTVLYALGRVEAARERFERAAALTPQAAYVQSNLCFAAFAEGALEQALMACDEALRLVPDLQAAQRNRERVEAALAGRQSVR